MLNDKKAGAGCTSRAFKHPGRDVTAPDVWPSILTDYTYDSELDNADGILVRTYGESVCVCVCVCGGGGQRQNEAVDNVLVIKVEQ